MSDGLCGRIERTRARDEEAAQPHHSAPLPPILPGLTHHTFTGGGMMRDSDDEAMIGIRRHQHRPPLAYHMAFPKPPHAANAA